MSYSPIPIDADGRVAVGNPRSAFGELLNVEPTPQIQIKFPYGVRLSEVRLYLTLTFPGTPTGAISAGDWFQAGTSEIVVLAVDDIGAADTEGLFEIAGYGLLGVLAPTDGETFTGLVESFVLGTGDYGVFDHADGKLKSSLPATDLRVIGFSSRRPLRYATGQGAAVRFTCVFNDPAPGLLQWGGIGDFGLQDGLFLHHNGTTWGFSRYANGAPEFVTQADWNIDTFDGNGPSEVVWNPLSLHPIEISYQWLGGGILVLSIEDPATGEMRKAHAFRYAGTSDMPSMANPNLPITFRAENSGHVSAATIQVPSLAGFTQGSVANLGDTIPLMRSLTGVGTSLVPLVSFRLPRTFGGVSNRIVGHLRTITISGSGNKPIHAMIVRNCQLTGAVWADVRPYDASLQGDTTATAYSGGDDILPIAAGEKGGSFLDTDLLGIDFMRGDTLTLVVATTSGTTDIIGGMSIQELT